MPSWNRHVVDDVCMKIKVCYYELMLTKNKDIRNGENFINFHFLAIY